MSTGRILIVEDDEELAPILIEALDDEGYTAEAAHNGVDGLEKVRRERPALILLDLMMPVMDGWQMHAELKRDPALATIPVVVMSADGRTEEKASILGAAGCLPKPIALEALVAEIKRHVS